MSERDEYGGVDETTEDARMVVHQAEERLECARSATLDTDALLEERQGVLASIRGIYVENHFAEKYRSLFRAGLWGAGRA